MHKLCNPFFGYLDVQGLGDWFDIQSECHCAKTYVKDEKQAIKLAQDNNQQSVCDWEKQYVIPTGGTGESKQKTENKYTKSVDEKKDFVKSKMSNEIKPFEKEKSVNSQEVRKISISGSASRSRGGVDEKDAKRCVEIAEGIAKKAEAREPKITKDVVGAVADQGGAMYGLDFRRKQVTSMAGKIAADAKKYEGSFDKAASNIKDSIRYTAIMPDENFTSGYENVKSSLEKAGYKEVRCKNYYQMYADGKSNQKAVQCVYDDPDGEKFELQFHTVGSQAAKELNHPLYEEARKQTTSEERVKELNDIMIDIGKNDEDPADVMTIKQHNET